MKENARLIEVQEKISSDLASYEKASEHYLLKNVPVIVRIDGKNFKHLTRGLEKPFDERLNEVMKDTLIGVCRHVKGVVMGYAISDEIDLLILDNSSYWYDYNIQGLVASISSIVTGMFNRFYNEKIPFQDNNKRIGLFDVVAFNVPIEHVSDYFIKKQNYEIRVNLEYLCSLYGITKDYKKCSNFELKKILKAERAIDYENMVNMQDRVGIVATMNSSNDYSVLKNTPLFEENLTFINNVLDVPLFDIDLEEE